MSLPALALLAFLALSDASLLRRPDERVVNGEDAKEGEIPYQVSLQNRFSKTHFCGGSILNEHYVITAAHCLTIKLPIAIRVVAGTINLKSPRSVHNVEKFIIHEEYSRANSWNNDIALIKVETPFVKSQFIDFVPLPSPDEVIKANDVAVTSGWGRLWTGGALPDHLQRVNIFISDQEYCKIMYKKIGHTIHDSHVCAFDPTEEKGSCHGDSGGPLTVKGKLIGLVSWAKSCALTDYPTVYTRVTSHLEWIKANTV